jgi:PhzF family phenazine biosynthesis protein
MRLLQIDAFTDVPFHGNPAAVCLLDHEREAGWMQDVAAEMNLSETAFLLRQADGFSLRWFTPAVEVNLCGHATLASAHALWEEEILPAADAARFHTRSGLLTATRTGGWIELDFPSQPAKAAEPPPGLLEALGISAPLFVGKNVADYLVELDDAGAVRAVSPGFAALRRIDARAVMVTSRGDGTEYDFISRFFAPAVGVDEDPVTGSAHTCLTPYWTSKLGREQLLGFQASRRGGVIRVRQAGERVKLAGQAVTVVEGELKA